MIIVTGSIVARVEAADAAVKLCIEHSTRSRAEPGCLLHTIHRDLENPLRLVFLEHWTDRDALNDHFRVPSSGQFVEKLNDLVSEPPVMHISETR